MKIAPSVYFYPFTSFLDNNCNSILIDGETKVLIDPGHKRFWPDLKEMMEKDGFNPADISLVIHTHCHPDHMEAGEFLEKEYGAVQAMGRLEHEFLQGPGLEFFPWMGLEVPTGNITRFLDEGPLDLGDKTLELYLAPGHTPGSLCIHWPEAKVLITGDVVFAQSVGRSDFAGGNNGALGATVERLSQLKDIDFLLPGHGPAVEGEAQVAKNFEVVQRFFK